MAFSTFAARDVRKPFGWRFTGPLLLGSTLNPINSSMIATALAGVGVDFHRGPASTASLISVLYLCSAVMQPTMGKLATLFGARRIFLTGATILLIGGIVGAAAPTFEFLLASRALIGIGTSAAYPTAMALIPLALITVISTVIGVAKDEPADHAVRTGLMTAVDLVGIALFAGTITSLLLFLSHLATPAWWQLATATVLGAALIGWERRAPRPLIDVRMLARNRPLLFTYLRQCLASLGIYTMLYGTSQWMEGAAHYTASQVGLIMLPMSAASIVVARVVAGRGWVRWPLIFTGAAFALTGVVMLGITHTSNALVLIGMSLLFGLANGFSGFANQASLYIQTAPADVAIASGLFRTFSYIGSIFSSSLIGIAFGHTVTDSGLHIAAYVIAAIGIATLLMTILDRKVPGTTKS